jgi:intracellular septation protein
MQALLEFAPLVAFFAAYSLGGLYVATAVLMAAMAVLLIVDYLRLRRVPAMHALSAVLVFLFGTATLVLHDLRFIQWKPTVFFWLAALAFLGSQWIGKQTLTQRLLSAALGGDENHRVPDSTWKRLNIVWVVFYVALGALNLFVAFNFSESFWVRFKVIGLTAINFVFIGAQVAWLVRRFSASSGEPSPQSR